MSDGLRPWQPGQHHIEDEEDITDLQELFRSGWLSVPEYMRCASIAYSCEITDRIIRRLIAKNRE